MGTISIPVFYFKPEFMPRKLGLNELPTDAEFKEYGRWCVFGTNGKDPVYPTENTREAALKMSRTPIHNISTKTR